MTKPSGGRMRTTLILKRFVLGLLALSQPARAINEISFGDWQVGWSKDGSAIYAGIGKDPRESVLMQACYFGSGSCGWVMGSKDPCVMGKTYPALANTDEASVAITLTCEGYNKNGNYRLVVDDDYALEKLMRRGEFVSIAVPIDGARFRSHRFSLKGMLAALAMMRDDLKRRANTSDSRQPVTSSTF